MLRESHTTFFSQGSVSQANLLGQHHSESVIKPCALASAVPIGTIGASASAAGVPVPVFLLGQVPHPIMMVSAGAVSLGAFVYTAASGRVQSEPSAAGTYYKVGIALQAATASGQEILVSSCIPEKLVVEQPI